MRSQIYQGEDERQKKPKRRFVIFPEVCGEATLPYKKYLVWWEWVEWSDAYGEWQIIR